MISETLHCTFVETLQDSYIMDNVKFHDSSWHSSAALGILSVTHTMPVPVLNTCIDTNMQLTINSFRQLFPDKIFSPDISLIFSNFPYIFLTAVTFPDISSFSIQVVTLYEPL